MNLIYLLISSFIIGVCAILPGISGSVFAVVLGIYDLVINTIFDKNLKFISKIKIILPISLGVFLGIFIFGNIMFIMFKKYEIYFKYTFIGIIIGTIPSLNKEIIKKNNTNLKALPFFITFLLSIILFLLQKNFINSNSNITNLKLFLGGILYISGKIIPGISSSIFMMILGLYDYFLLFISNPIYFIGIHFYKIIPFLLGSVFGLIILIKLINYCLNNYHVNTYSSIIGFVSASVIAIFPGFIFEIKYYIGLIFMSISFLITYFFTKN